MRRLLQVFALMLVILSGSLPGLRLLGSAKAAPCTCGMPMDSCPMKAPERSSGPTAPCTLGAPATGFLYAAPRQAPSATRAERSEPLPWIQAPLPRAATRFLAAAGPAMLARPGPPFQPCSSRLAKLSVFRI